MSTDLVAAPFVLTGTAVSQEHVERLGQVERIRAVEDPVLRNLLITQFYHETAQALGARLGAENVTWFAFGTWASNVAGSYIRGTAIPRIVREIANGDGPLPDGIEKLTRQFLAEFQATMAQGNLIVFEELGPIAAGFLAVVDQDPAAVQPLLDAIAPDSDGRTLLRNAFECYAQAARAIDTRARAQLVLAANLLAVYHEQRRLQPLLEQTLTPPFVGEFRLRISRRVAKVLTHEWREFATKYMLQYDLPDGHLRAGEDVPSTLPGGAFPPDIEELDLDPAPVIWRELCGDLSSTRGSAAHDWTNLRDRMEFIATVFRSRQQDAALLSPPFPAEVIDEIRAGRLPAAFVPPGHH